MIIFVCVSGLLDMLTRAQCSRVDDQRGLLTKEQLELPAFLQLSSDQGQNTEPDESCETSSSSTADSKEKDKPSTTSSSAGAEEETPDSAQSEPKDLRETEVWKTPGWGGCESIKNCIIMLANCVKRQKHIFSEKWSSTFYNCLQISSETAVCYHLCYWLSASWGIM